MKQLTTYESTLISGGTGIARVVLPLPVFTTSATIRPDGTVVVYCGDPGTQPPSPPTAS
jgi:hypothetical protein